MKNFLGKYISIALVTSLLIASGSAWAIGLSEAKKAGLIGEKSSGYLGAVSKPATSDVITLIKKVNNKRKTRYQEIAKKNKVDLKVIEVQAGGKLMTKTASGHFIYKNGGWTKK